MRLWAMGLTASIVGASALLSAMGGCERYMGEGRPEFKTAVIRGTVSYRERMALPSDATVRVQLLDVSVPGTPVLVSEQTQQANHQVPIDFAVVYYPENIRPDSRYGLSASITTGGLTVWSTPAPMPIVPGAEGGQQSLLLIRMRTDTQPGQ